ncbi:toll-like receptor 4 isoform X2 [Mercenaria mercenaria]|uniref:toll-like receptor 4 isoform X2 n=1 Tax=Mercenaria mercenaria TaxID=6596 RepID=UPI00234EDFC1|nr:toll-like receptor 4 isoform X2 [Mercenaria mercenaria]
MTFIITMLKSFTSLVFVCVFCPNWTLQMCTHPDTDTFSCDNEVPVALPTNVTRVFINIYSGNKSFNATLFSHKSWRYVTFLDIKAKYNQKYGEIVVSFSSMCFSTLDALQELRFQGDSIKEFSLDTFHNVKHLTELMFYECFYLNMDSVISALLNAHITIETMSLNDVSSGSEKQCNINDTFYDLLESAKVSSLSLRGTSIRLHRLKRWKKKPTLLKALDVSQARMLKLPENTNFGTLHEIYAPFIQGIKTLNISAIPLQFFLPDNDFLNNKTVRNCAELGHEFMKILYLQVENMYSDFIFHDQVIINNTLLNISDCNFSLKKWHFRKNRITYFNITFHLPLTNTLKEVDISNNEIKYISPSALKTARVLESLNLERNHLFQMENLPEFKDLLAASTALKYFSVADNNISNLPRDLFRNNVILEVIDLADNNLKTVTFIYKHLEKLRLLNIVRNRIKYIEGKALTNIQLFYKTRTSASIEMAGNPFECSCDSAEFMKWIITLVHQQPEKKHVCIMENEEVEIDTESFKLAKYLCYRTTVIISVSIVIVILVTGIIVLIRRKRKEKEKCKRKLFLKDFQKGILKEKYLCQISYSSEDAACVLNVINPTLNAALRKEVRCERDVICIGDKHFSLGRPIIDEILRYCFETSHNLDVTSFFYQCSGVG